MSQCKRCVGLDAHADTIAVAISEKRGEARRCEVHHEL
jgi:hypothetical protein